MDKPKRTFEDKPATRGDVPILVGLMGPSGGGKTYSALRLATGMQRVAGGDIYGIDTESRRMRHYADKFKFRHVEFTAPFGPLDYLAAIEHCVNKGAKIVIVDSMSHEHEGPGGVLEMHESELQRLSGGDRAKAERVSMLAWARPKAERRRLINSLMQLNVNFIFCFRAKEKIKIIPGNKQPEDLGWMPIAGEEFLYEMTLNCLLPPNANGVPYWTPEHRGEKMMVKLPQQFRPLFVNSTSLDETIGEELAKWSAGSAPKQERPKEPEKEATASKENGNGSSEIKSLIDAFGEYGIDKIEIESRLGCSMEHISDLQKRTLTRILPQLEKGKKWKELWSQ